MSLSMAPSTIPAALAGGWLPLLVAVALPITLSTVFGLRKEPAVFAAVVLGSVLALIR